MFIIYSYSNYIRLLIIRIQIKFIFTLMFRFADMSFSKYVIYDWRIALVCTYLQLAERIEFA